MKVGDLVKFKAASFSDDHLYLVIEQVQTWDRKGPTYPFSKWQICNTSTGKVYTQNARDLEVISESR